MTITPHISNNTITWIAEIRYQHKTFKATGQTCAAAFQLCAFRLGEYLRAIDV